MESTISVMNIRLLLNSFVFFLFFQLSYFLIQNYTEGDQEHYRKLYETFSETLLVNILKIGLVNVGSSEPLTMFVLWSGAQLGIDKDFYISFWNALLALGLFVLSRKYKMNYIFIFLLLTNFYVVVLMTGAERLKFAFIVIVYSFVFFNVKKNASLSLVLISPLFHFQSLIFISGYVVYLASEHFLRFFYFLKIKKKALLFLIVLIISFSFVFVSFGHVLFSKIDAYYAFHSIVELRNILVLSVIVLLLTKNKLAFSIMLGIMALFVLILGGERVNMIAFFISLFFLILEKRADHPLFLLLMVYFSVKSIPFVNNIMVHGNGFYGCC
ncbi:MAG: hypothetical protein IE909_12365 [Campylobacterales bacterium]|nr:hypothetical protein [Campylobacterales bacterium]